MLRLWTLKPRNSVAGVRHLHATLSNNAAPSTSATTEEAGTKWTPGSIRTGLIARKRGMAAMWDNNGARFPVTVLQLENCQVTANVKTVRDNGSEYHAVQVAASDRSEKTTTKPMLGHFKRAGVAPKRIVKEFAVTPDAHVPVGTTLSAIHFVPGQFVDVISNSIGKGFQGTMKRWNFKGLRASHGVSVSHRSAGAIGAHQDPGRVWPGKKMAGRLGGERTTTQNLAVVRVDTTLDLIFVRGCVPGVDDAFVMIRDAKKKMESVARIAHAKGEFDKVLPKNVDDLPFPAGTKELAAQLPPVIVAPSHRVTSPFTPRE
ncbi:50S ribosomal protein L3 [Phanerochaete sordida]|uniref:Large ribosomal subunit protein uL3m n=1 Tax=Phanerochaete sordida TaxID=48140 RepID=A0A9P3G7K7_9APHY|nr:50S ribosomal protein L3 [Phanerochaete sordida]